MYKTNVGMADRTVRVILGLAVISLFFAYPDSGWSYLALLGVIPLLTGVFGTCPVYSLLGMSTCPAGRA